MYQKIVIVGNVGRDPNVNTTPNGNTVANFSVAVNDYKDQVTWVKVTVWNKLAELVSQYVKSGSRVLCEGRFTTNQEGYYPAWLTKDGEARSEAAITANNVRFLSSRGEQNGTVAPPTVNDLDSVDLDLDLVDEIPF